MMTALYDCITSCLTAVCLSSNIDVAGSLNDMTAIGDLFLHNFHAYDLVRVLILPASWLGELVTAWQRQLLSYQDYSAFSNAWIATNSRARVIAATDRSRTRFEAVDNIMQHARVAFGSAGMPACKSPIAHKFAAAFGRYGHKVLCLRHFERRIWMTGALQRKTLAETVRVT